MADTPVLGESFVFSDRAGQCPSCFSFNSADYLPEGMQQIQKNGLVLTCATCGTPYEVAGPRAA